MADEKFVNLEKKYFSQYEYPRTNGTETFDVYKSDGKLIYREHHYIDKDDFPAQSYNEVCRTPFIICGKSKPTEDGTVYYTIRYGIEQREFTVPKSDLSPLQKLKVTLAKYDINVTGNLAKETEEYISVYIHVLGDRLHTTTPVTCNGWNGDCTLFAMGKNGITKDGIVPITTIVDDPLHSDAITTKGTLEGWVKAGSELLEYDRARFRFYDAMTAPLIKPLGQENVILGHHGDSSRGKTTEAWFMSSTLGNPKDLEFKADSTSNAILAHAVGMCDMPIDIEEATSDKSKDIIAGVMYTLSNGADKGRCTIDGKLRGDVKPFRTYARITTENPISDNIKNIGGLVRARELNELLPDGLGGLARRTKEGIQKNYGFFFPMYVQYIINNMGRLEGMYNSAYEKLVSEIDVPKESRGIVERQAQIFALDVVAGVLVEELFKEIGIPTKTPEEVEAIVSDYFKKMVTSKPVETAYIKALLEISAWVATTKEFYIDGENNYSNKISGEVTNTEIKIIGKAFTEKMKSIGLSTSVKKDFVREGIIDDTNKPFRINGQLDKGIIIKRKIMESKLGLLDENKEENANISVNMKYGQIIETVSFMTKKLGKDSVSEYVLRIALGYDVQEHLNKLEKMGKVIKRPNGGYL